eukprot:scaffold181513_cov59-Attheya_sp.AAC.3
MHINYFELFARKGSVALPVLWSISPLLFHKCNEGTTWTIAALISQNLFFVGDIFAVTFEFLNFKHLIFKISLFHDCIYHDIICLFQVLNRIWPHSIEIFAHSLFKFAKKVISHMSSHRLQIRIRIPDVGAISFCVTIRLFPGTIMEEKVDSFVPCIIRKNLLFDDASLDRDSIEVSEFRPRLLRKERLHRLTQKNGNTVLLTGTHHTGCHVYMR